jgi:hypothetical protein
MTSSVPVILLDSSDRRNRAARWRQTRQRGPLLIEPFICWLMRERCPNGISCGRRGPGTEDGGSSPRSPCTGPTEPFRARRARRRRPGRSHPLRPAPRRNGGTARRCRRPGGPSSIRKVSLWKECVSCYNIATTVGANAESDPSVH